MTWRTDGLRQSIWDAESNALHKEQNKNSWQNSHVLDVHTRWFSRCSMQILPLQVSRLPKRPADDYIDNTVRRVQSPFQCHVA
jgi:hypothetical protein